MATVSVWALVSPYFVTILYGDASFGRAGDDDDDQHNKTFLYLYVSLATRTE